MSPSIGMLDPPPFHSSPFFPSHPAYSLSDSIHHKLVDQILPVSHHYVNVHKYVTSKDQFESGLVSHALCAAINTILKVPPLPFPPCLHHEY